MDGARGTNGRGLQDLAVAWREPDDRRLSAAGMRFAIATPHAAATAAGAAAFDDGGNAIDAALAAAATLAVVYPHNCGIGGDLFALVARPGADVVSVNSSGAAPTAIDADALRREYTTMPSHGPLSITVPGCVAGWQALAELGTRQGLARALEPAIGFASEGFPVARSLARNLAQRVARLLPDPGFAELFLPSGRPLARGEALRLPALAASLELLRAEGQNALYGGEVGARLVAGLRRLGSPMTIEDLATHRAEVTAPLSAPYRDHEVLVAPPNSQGFVLPEALRAIERLEIDPDPLGSSAPTIAAVFALAGADRNRYLADPQRAHVPVEELLGDANIERICEFVRTRANGVPLLAPDPSGDTIALVTADSDGYAVSLIQSNADAFGSGILEPTTGVISHNRGSGFSLDPTSPNALEGGKRPAHTLMPVLVRRAGRVAAVSGSMGGGAQPQINGQNLIRLLDLGLTPHEAIDAPRWLLGGMDLESGSEIEMEDRVPLQATEALVAAGYEMIPLGDYAEGVGHAHLIRVGSDGSLEAATDRRADGEADAR